MISNTYQSVFHESGSYHESESDTKGSEKHQKQCRVHTKDKQNYILGESL